MPSPIDKFVDLETAAVFWKLGEIRSDQLPSIAGDLLGAGIDNRDLRMLAGLVDTDIEQAPTLFEAILDDAGYGAMPLVRAVHLYIRFVAQKIVLGELAPYQGAQKIFEATVRADVTNFHGADAFIYAADEYEDRPEDRSYFDAAIREEAERWLASEAESRDQR